MLCQCHISLQGRTDGRTCIRNRNVYLQNICHQSNDLQIFHLGQRCSRRSLQFQPIQQLFWWSVLNRSSLLTAVFLHFVINKSTVHARYYVRFFEFFPNIIVICRIKVLNEIALSSRIFNLMVRKVKEAILAGNTLKIIHKTTKPRTGGQSTN